jgi:hypothetical protein
MWSKGNRAFSTATYKDVRAGQILNGQMKKNMVKSGSRWSNVEWSNELQYVRKGRQRSGEQNCL